MSEQNKIIGKRIKERRKALKMTQKELGEKIGCAEITIRQYENGRNAPKIDTRIKIANALEISYGSLFNPDNSELVARLPEVGVSVEGDADPANTQARFDRIRIEDITWNIRAVVEKAGLVTPVSGPAGITYYLHGEDRRAVKVDSEDYDGYLKRQLANMTNYHYDYVDILRSMEKAKDKTVTPDVNNDSSDNHHK